jgi:peptide/nickel transport system permease protein
MIGFIGWRLVQLVPLGFGVTLVSFMLVRLVPGDPALTILGTYATPSLIEEVRQQLGLDQPLPIQYLIFLQRLLGGDLGHSYFYRQSVSGLIFDRMGVTLFLAAFAATLSTLVSLPLALLAAVWRERPLDKLIRSSLVLGTSLPGYWVGLLLILFFALGLGLFPAGGYGDTFAERVRALTLPAFTLSIGMVPTLVRALRSSLVESLNADFVSMARSKGLPERVVVLRHALRTALIPTVTILGLNIGFMVGGMVIIESVFGVPGLGQLMINAITSRDYPIVQAATLLFAVIVVVVSLCTDLITLLLDPRLRARTR